MSSWFSQIRSFLKPESNPTKVIEVKQEKYADRIIRVRGDGIILYAPGAKDNQEYYEIILLRPCNENSGAFRFVRNSLLTLSRTYLYPDQ